MHDNDRVDQIGHAAMLAWSRVKRAQVRMWSEWMVIGDGLLEGRRWAMRRADTNRPEGKGFVVAYSEWLKRFKLDDMDKSDRAKLLQLMEERPAVEEWRASLTDHERRNLNNPVVVWRKWTAATRVKKPRPRTAGVSATEHGRARDVIEQLQARIAELQEELREGRTPDAGQRGLARTQAREEHTDWSEAGKLRAENAHLRAEIKRLRPTLDGETIKLRKQVEELRGERASLKQVMKEVGQERDKLLKQVKQSKVWNLRSRTAQLDRPTFNAIAKALHPDRVALCSEADLAEAGRLFLELKPLFAD